MKLSVIIVNYNVKYFLEQCLLSVYKSLKNIDGEVIIVDNASVDGSCHMVKQRFPQVILIENTVNYGFSYANNQAIRLSQGEYVLLLNPDTIVEEDTFYKCLNFMANHSDAGSLTVKMIDGKGRFLPESKRALPTPIVSFYKIVGLTRLFPHSKIFGKYHLGHLNKDVIHQIDILPGAFMFIRKKILDEIGLLDESFFMYGEDIDLSYRIIKAGYKNYYYPETKIVHYKGESTKKGSLNYVLTFYKAMAIFAKKHFSQKNAKIYLSIIYIAIIFRATISAIRRIFGKILLTLIDLLVISVGVSFIINTWELLHYESKSYFPESIVLVMTLLYTAIWLFSIWLLGGYDKPQKIFNSTRGTLAGLLLILVVYALLPADYRFSRVIIVFGGIWVGFATFTARFFVNLFDKKLMPAFQKKKRIVIIGNSKESEKILEILNGSGSKYNLFGIISPTDSIQDGSQLSTIDRIEELIRINSINEVIFCGSEISSQQIINTMLRLSASGVEYKIAPMNSVSLIGSNFVNSPENLYSPEYSTIGEASSKRYKRIFDILASFSIVMLSPVILIIKPKFKRVNILEILSALIGTKTLIGYIPNERNKLLPFIKPCVFPLPSFKSDDPESIFSKNLLYAKNYKVKYDINYLIMQLKHL